MRVCQNRQFCQTVKILNTHLCLLLRHLNFHLSEKTRSLEPVSSFKQCWMLPDCFHPGTKLVLKEVRLFCSDKLLSCENCCVRAPTGGGPSLPDRCSSLLAAQVVTGQRLWARLLRPLPPVPPSPKCWGKWTMERVGGARLT